jgi:hypothetical protein
MIVGEAWKSALSVSDRSLKKFATELSEFFDLSPQPLVKNQQIQNEFLAVMTMLTEL